MMFHLFPQKIYLDGMKVYIQRDQVHRSIYNFVFNGKEGAAFGSPKKTTVNESWMFDNYSIHEVTSSFHYLIILLAYSTIPVHG